MNKVEELQKSRLFEGLLPEEIEMLAELTQHKKFSQGEVVFEQGDVGDSLYLLVEGAVDVVQKRKDELDRVRDIAPPDIIYGDQAPPLNLKPGKGLKGIPTSRGHYTGPARILQGIQDLSKLK